VVLLFFFRSAIAALNANHNGHLGRFFCSTAPQAFSRPDRVRSRPTRRRCQGWPRSGHRRLGLYIGEHDGMLDASGRMIDLLACVFWRGLIGRPTSMSMARAMIASTYIRQLRSGLPHC
jgi:hypothetical protein